MKMGHESTESHCSSCSACPIEDCPTDGGNDPQLLVGWQFGFASMGLFLGPVVLAIIGAAWCFGESSEGRLLGAIAGLMLGMVASMGIARWLSRDFE